MAQAERDRIEVAARADRDRLQAVIDADRQPLDIIAENGPPPPPPPPPPNNTEFRLPPSWRKNVCLLAPPQSSSDSMR